MQKPPEPEVIRVLAQYRAALDARETGLMDEMARRWVQVEARLNSDILALAYEVDRRKAEGKVITEQIIWREERYKQLHAQMEVEIARYNREAAILVEQVQGENATLGISAANDAIHVSYPMGSSPMWTRINLGAVQSMIGFAGDGSPLHKLLKEDYPDAVDGLLKALINGVARGQGPAQTARDMADGMGMGLDRALLIARTETNRAYRTASTEQYRQSGVVDGYYRLVKKGTACMACLMLDGQHFDTADELGDHPRGKCVAVPQCIGVAKPRWESGVDYFKALPPDQQAARMGPEKYQLWQDGQIKLSDLARMTHNDTWGDSPRVATLAELAK
jgi:SPP1 gp7 family putative phage head morphogenesis protein